MRCGTPAAPGNQLNAPIRRYPTHGGRPVIATGAALDPSDEQWQQLPARGIEVVTGRVAALEFTHDRLNGVRLSSGWLFPCQAVVIMPRFHPTPTWPPARGLEPDEQQMGRCGRQLRASTRPGPPRYRECGWPATCHHQSALDVSEVAAAHVPDRTPP